MTPPPIKQMDKNQPALAGRLGRTRGNTARPIQVMPPHNVELPLPATTYDDLHVPAHVSGADLSREAPADAERGPERAPRRA